MFPTYDVDHGGYWLVEKILQFENQCKIIEKS